ncbi:S-adenosyl-L-methionine-dependent methyltransferase [Helicostylum pulchrum]|uniref:type I protein arginine methyltransferase n=1 Tax=Helicostylum pulchrum TaxID=562976 RepID=A0ABP9Y315_9FUNG|nr:S-adenosyl-L-methionine-dependent methyltransferase [Helicostylum pulchrum]
MAHSICNDSQYEPSEYDPQDVAWDDWSNDEEEEESQCLFCPQTFTKCLETFQHIKEQHGFDFQAVKRDLRLDFYKCIRMINYIRKQVQINPDLATAKEFKLTGSEPFWTQDEYLQPVLTDDALLFAFEELEDLEDQPTTKPFAPLPTVDLNQITTTTELETQLLNLLMSTQEKTENLQGQFEEYKSMVKKRFFDTIANEESDPSSSAALIDQGNYYFNGYAQNDIHEQMLKDRARTEAYRDFVYENKDVFKNKIVLDVGCGTGILSMFAAKAGAKQVFSVDNSAIIEKAKLNIKENGLDHIITCVRGKVEEIELPVPQVDIIISEWMGYFLLFEAMLDSVLVARDRWLAPNGIMAPSQTRILMAALDDEDLKNDKVNFWSDVYGFKMSAMKEPTLNEAVVDFIRPNSVVSTVVTLKDLPLQTITIKQLDFVNTFEVEITKDSVVTAFGGWFDTWFTRDGHSIPLDQESQKVPGEIFMTTSPFGEDTHWKQTSFILEKPIHATKGTKISGVFTCHKGTDNPRELECEIEYRVHGETFVQNFVLQS